MRREPENKRVYAFFDGQNLYHAVKEAFGYTYPNYDPLQLARVLCNKKKWNLAKVNFYTGMPDKSDDKLWHHFWTQKLQVMGSRGIRTFSRSLRYSNEKVILPDGREITALVGREKGIDVRIALDIVRMARHDLFDVALIFSQDQDLSEVAKEVRAISAEHDRWIKIACAFPVSPTVENPRGINGTDWIEIDRKMYDSCLDPINYRTKK
ncbi:MAG: NYN domain-containing protein [bacterium]|nr:NYN domain-containing protein [bacterium]